MVEVLKSAGLLIFAAAVIVYTVATWRADQQECESAECELCPFPCENRKEGTEK